MPPRRSRRAAEASIAQEDTMTNTENTELEPTAGTSLSTEDLPESPTIDDTEFTDLPQAEDLDVETPAEPDADDEVEELPADAEASDDKPKVAKKEKAQPKRGELPDGYVTPIGLTKAINEQGLYRNREGEVADLKPQMVYSYIKNAPKERPYPGTTVTDSVGTERENCVLLEEGLAWWNAKNEAAEARRKNAADKAAKAKEAAEKKAAKASAGEGDTEAPADEPAGVVEEAE